MKHTPDLLILSEDLTDELLSIAEQLESWADESLKGGWSTHQVDPMLRKACDLRKKARRVEGIINKQGDKNAE